MFESIVTISLTGFIAGFIFAMPIAGPISILIVSNALNGRLLFSNRVSLGAAIPDFFYIFIAIYGVTRLYSYYAPAIPYLFIAGAVFFIALGLRIFKSPVDLGNLEDKTRMTERIKNQDRGGFYTGFMINLLNPTLFISGLISSFFVISLIAALGLNTGGLETKIHENVREINSIDGGNLEEQIPVDRIKKLQENNERLRRIENVAYPPSFHLIISTCYAFFISLGGLLWFYLLAYTLARYRGMINIKILSTLIKAFGVSLVILGLYSGYLGIERFM